MVPSNNMTSDANPENDLLKSDFGPNVLNRIDELSLKISRSVSSSDFPRVANMDENTEERSDIINFEEQADEVKNSGEISKEEDSTNRSLFEEAIEDEVSGSKEFKTPVTQYSKSLCDRKENLTNNFRQDSVPNIPLQSPMASPRQNISMSHNGFTNPQMLNSSSIHGPHLFGSVDGGLHHQGSGRIPCHGNPYFNSTHSFSPAEHWFWEQHRQNQQAALVWPSTGGDTGQHKGGVVGCGPNASGIGSDGVAGQNGSLNPGQQPQNLMHWMSFMAEHMNNPHHDAAPHYMWNGVDSKMGGINHDHHQNSPSPMTKVRDYYANFRPINSFNYGQTNPLDDRLDHRNDNTHSNNNPNHHNNGGGNPNNNSNVLGDITLTHNMTPSSALYVRSNGSASSSSPPTVSTPSMLVVPHPINAAKMPTTPSGIGNQANGGGGSVRKYQCKMCPQIFGSKAELQMHTQIHMREAKPFKCSQCPKAFANGSYLSQHTRIHLGIKPYTCDICQRKFTQLSHLQQHIRTHTGDKPYKCRHPGCNKAFSQLSNLQSHSRCHQTDKPYKCNSCYKCFIDEASLLEHIPKHKESKHLKTHICQYCGKSYTQETYLQKHMQKHAERTDKRPPLTGVAAMGLRQEHPYWPKQENLALDHMDGRMDTHCQQNNLDHTRQLTASVHREHMEQQHRMEDLRQTNTPAHMGGNMPYDAIGTKTSSAFTPIQTSMLPIGGSTQLSMAASSNYRSFYDSFSKSQHQVPSMDVKPHHQFPNNLIALDQIRNYSAHQPMTQNLLLKDKGIAQ